jgi:hypothetical protein
MCFVVVDIMCIEMQRDRGGSFSQKLESAKPRYFIMHCWISCELAG